MTALAAVRACVQTLDGVAWATMPLLRSLDGYKPLRLYRCWPYGPDCGGGGAIGQGTG